MSKKENDPIVSLITFDLCDSYAVEYFDIANCSIENRTVESLLQLMRTSPQQILENIIKNKQSNS